MSTAEDEEIVRKRLAAGTVQLRGDYPFRTLAKLFHRLSAAALNGTETDVEEVHAALARELEGMALAAEQKAAVAAANRREQAMYERRKGEIQESIEQEQRSIELRKAELAEARLQKQRNEEYEALRRECMRHAKRSTTRANIEKTKAEIAAVDAESQKMTATIDRRRQHFAEVLQQIDRLQQTLEAEDGSDGPAPMQE